MKIKKMKYILVLNLLKPNIIITILSFKIENGLMYY
jgi:hypothetical protein